MDLIRIKTKFSPVKIKTILFLVGTLNLIGYWTIAFLGDLRQHLPLFFTVYALLSVLFLSSVFSIRKIQPASATASAKQAARDNLQIVVLILAFAVVSRFVLLPNFPWLTDDIFRYIWDGRVWNSGINPFEYAPADPALLHLRDAAIYSHVNHPAIPTIYAPVLQLLFRFTAALAETIFAFKMMVLLFEFATLGLLLVLLKLWQRPLSWILIYAWNPLVIIETAGSGHLDGIGMFFLLLAFLFLSVHPAVARKPLKSGMRFLQIFQENGKAPMYGVEAGWGKWEIGASITLGLAVLVKFIPVLILPFLLLHKSRKRQLVMISFFLLTIFIGYLPFLSAGSKLFAATVNYAAKWRFNDSLFFILYKILDFIVPAQVEKSLMELLHLLPTAEKLITFRMDLLLYAGKLILAWFFLFSLWKLFRSRRSLSPMSAEQIAQCWIVLFGLLCLITPTLHPWYILWLLPLTVFYRENSLLVLSCTIIWSYEIVGRYAETGIWQENPLIKLAVFAPFYGVLFMEGKYRDKIYPDSKS